MNYNNVKFQYRRAIYIGHPIEVEVWQHGKKPSAHVFYGMTGDYIGDTFISDDLECPSFNIESNQLYFPRS